MAEDTLMSSLKKRKKKEEPAAPQGVDLSGVREQMQERSDRRALMAGATPLLVGFLSGNVGDAVEVAGKALLDEDRRSMEEEESLLKYLQKRTGKEGDRKLYQVRDPKTGDLTYHYAGEAHKKLAPRRRRTVEEVGEVATTRELGKLEAGVYGKKFLKTREGEQVVVDIPTLERRKVFGDEKFEVSPRFEKRADTVVDKFTSDMKGIRDVQQSLTEARNLLKSEGQLPSKVAIQAIIRKVEGGRMSDEDRRYYTSSVSRVASLREAFEEETNEKVRARLKREAAETLDLLINSSYDRIGREAKSRAKSNARSRREYRYLLNRLQPGGRKRMKVKPPISKRVKTKKATTENIGQMTDEQIEERIKQLQGKK